MGEFKVGEKVRTITGRTAEVVFDVPDREGNVVVQFVDHGYYLAVGAQHLTRVHPTRYVVEHRQPRALEYILPLSPQRENKAGLFFVHEGGMYGVKFFEGQKRFCVVKDVDPDDPQRPPAETVRTIERRVPQDGELYISRFLQVDGVPRIIRAVGKRPDDELGRKDVIVEKPVPRPVWYVIERRTPEPGEQGIFRGRLALGRQGSEWAITRVIS